TSPVYSTLLLHPMSPPLSLHDALPICGLCRILIMRGINPTTEEPLEEVAEHSSEQVAEALKSASAAFASWRETPMSERARLMRRSEEHTSELQSRGHLVCRLLLEKKKK